MLGGLKYLFCCSLCVSLLEKNMESFPPGWGVKGEFCRFCVARQSKGHCDATSFKGELKIILAVSHRTDT